MYKKSIIVYIYGDVGYIPFSVKVNSIVSFSCVHYPLMDVCNLPAYLLCVFHRFSGIWNQQFNADSEWLNQEVLLGRNISLWFVIALQKNDHVKKIILPAAGIEPKLCRLIEEPRYQYTMPLPHSIIVDIFIGMKVYSLCY